MVKIKAPATAPVLMARSACLTGIGVVLDARPVRASGATS